MSDILEFKPKVEIKEDKENKDVLEGLMKNLVGSGAIMNEESIDNLENGFNAIAGILSLPDEHFTLISEVFLKELEKNLNDSNNQIMLSKIIKDNQIDANEFPQIIAALNKEIDENLDELPQDRRDFLKRLISTSMNSMIEYSGAGDIANIPIELCNPNAKIPTYANPTDAGLDIYALEDIEVLPGETKLVKTGLKVAIPNGYELQVRPKSGRALKTKLRIANSPGTIDSGYRDEIGVIIENVEAPIQDIDYDFDEKGNIIIKSILHGKVFMIEKGQKFAQLVLNKVSHAVFFEVENIGEIPNDGRKGGFGSTDLK